MKTPVIIFRHGFYYVYRYGFLRRIYTNEADALAFTDELLAQKTTHPDYTLVYSSRDGTGYPRVIVHD